MTTNKINHTGYVNVFELKHFGIIPAIIASFAFSIQLFRRNWVLAAAAAIFLFSWSRINWFYPVEYVVDLIPFLSTIAGHYWGAMICFSFPFMVAFGLDHLNKNYAAKWPVFAIYIAVSINIGYLFVKLGWPDKGIFQFYVLLTIFIFTAMAIFLILIHKFPKYETRLKQVLVLALALEMIFYMNNFRHSRFEIEDRTPKIVKYIQNNIGDNRILNIGRDSIHPNWSAIFHIQKIGVYNSDFLLWYRDFFHRSFGNEWVFPTLGRFNDRKVNIAEKSLDSVDVK